MGGGERERERARARALAGDEDVCLASICTFVPVKEASKIEYLEALLLRLSSPTARQAVDPRAP